MSDNLPSSRREIRPAQNALQKSESDCVKNASIKYDNTLASEGNKYPSACHSFVFDIELDPGQWRTMNAEQRQAVRDHFAKIIYEDIPATAMENLDIRDYNDSSKPAKSLQRSFCRDAIDLGGRLVLSGSVMFFDHQVTNKAALPGVIGSIEGMGSQAPSLRLGS